MAVRIAACQDEHIPGLRALWAQCLSEESAREAVAAITPGFSHSTLLLVASDGADVIGSIMASYDGHRGWLYALAVLPDYRFNHIATKLVIEAERGLTAIGCSKINLQLWDSEEQAQQLYKTLGYVTDDRISMGKRLEYS